MLRYVLAMHTVAVLAFDGVVAFDLAVPCQAFSAAWRSDGTPRYAVRVCGDQDVTATAVGVPSFQVRCDFPLDAAADADTIVVPGVARHSQPPEPRVLELLRTAAGNGARIASICTGAFVLAAAGLLDGLRATTHWRAAQDLARSYPRVTVDPAVLFVDNGQVLTSAGAAAGLDLCLHMIRTDHGAAAAADAARTVVMPPQRDGEQAQIIRHPAPRSDGPILQSTLQWMHENLHLPLTLGDIARHAHLSVRSLNRQFRAQTGTTPRKWLLTARLDHARELLETTDLPVERIAALAGFGSPVTLRSHFASRIGPSPSAYRATFKLQKQVRP